MVRRRGVLGRKLRRDMGQNAMQFLAMIALCFLGTWVFAGLDANWRMEERTIEDDVLLGMVTNATSVGGFKALDEGIVQMDDGMNELALVRAPRDIAEFNAILGSLIVRDYPPEYFHILQSSSVTLDFDAPVPWTLDGEFGGDLRHVEIRNIPTPLRIMTPARKD